MHNLNAFFKLRAKELNLSHQEIAEYIGNSKAYVSRLFNNQRPIKDKRLLKSLCSIMNLDENKVTYIDDSFENYLSQYLKAVFFIDDKKHELYHKIMQYKDKYYNTPYYIDMLFTELIQLSIVSNFRKVGHEYPLRKLFSVKDSLYNDERKLLNTIYFAALNHHRIIEEGERIFDEALSIPSNHKDIDMFLYYLGFTFPWNTNCIKRDIDCYYCCKNYAELTNNVEILINLDIKYAMFLGNNGDIRSELNCYLNLLESKMISENHRNYKIVLNNIAYAYMTLNEYKKALPYLLKVLKYIQDNDLYFSIAWCYYKQGLTKLASSYIEKGLNSFNHLDIDYDLLNWLQAMINKKYSSKSVKILQEVLEKYKSNINSNYLYFIKMEIANYYHFHGMEHEAYLQSIEIANKNIICITNMNDIL